MPKNRSWVDKFGDTLRGLRFAAQEQSFRTHLVVAAVVLIATGFFGATASEWLFIATAISAVMVSEIINTAIERMARAVTDEENPLIGQSLDLAAAAVLTASIYAVVVGLVILGPKLWTSVGW